MHPEIIIEIVSITNMVFCHMQDILTPLGSLAMESYLSYCPSGLSQGTSQTNKHTHFKQKEAMSPESLIENRKSIYIKKKKTLGFCYNEDSLPPPPHVPLIR